MEAFWRDAQSLFETARQASLNGSEDCDWAILIGPVGQIQIVEACGWTLPSLQAHHGAEAAFRIERRQGAVRLEGRRGGTACWLRSESPAATAAHLLASASAPEIHSVQARDTSPPVPADWLAREAWTMSA